MRKTIAMLCTALFAVVASADTWTDPKTGIAWTYTVSDGKASVGSGNYDGARAVPMSTTVNIPSHDLCNFTGKVQGEGNR